MRVMTDARYTFDFEKKELKILKKIEHKDAWGEEDENRFRNLIFLVEHSNESKGTKEGFIKFIYRLKSLEERYTWKPSKEQIMALRWVLNHIPYDSHKEEINGLLEQLLKLYNYGENR